MEEHISDITQRTDQLQQKIKKEQNELNEAMFSDLTKYIDTMFDEYDILTNTTVNYYVEKQILELISNKYSERLNTMISEKTEIQELVNYSSNQLY